MCDEYVCSLDEPSQRRSREELHEDPAQRQGAIDTLRKWLVESAPHIKSPTDTAFLLRYLRVAKFSQLKAREMIEKFITWKTKVPEWYTNIDPTDKVYDSLIDLGFIIPLPGRDKHGRRVVLVREGVYSSKMTKSEKDQLLKATNTVFNWLLWDENVQVNGVVYILDMTKFTTKHLAVWGIEDIRRFTSMWQGAIPARFKGFHFYNYGPVMDTMMGMMMPLLSKKFKERMFRHGNNLEKIYELVPMEMLPGEYLPDDYDGPNAGTVRQLIEKLKIELRDPKFVDHAKYISHEKFCLDESLRITDVPQSSFRKLNID